MVQAEGEAPLVDLHGLEDARVGQLLEAELVVHGPRRLPRVRLDAAHVVGLRGAERRRERVERLLELGADGRLARGAAPGEARRDERQRAVAERRDHVARDLCGIQPLVWVVLTKLQNSLARSNRGVRDSASAAHNDRFEARSLARAPWCAEAPPHPRCVPRRGPRCRARAMGAGGSAHKAEDAAKEAGAPGDDLESKDVDELTKMAYEKQETGEYREEALPPSLNAMGSDMDAMRARRAARPPRAAVAARPMFGRGAASRRRRARRRRARAPRRRRGPGTRAWSRSCATRATSRISRSSS